MSDYPNALNQGATKDRPNSRIEHDVETLKKMVSRIQSCTSRNVRNAISLGYFTPQPSTSAGQGPMPVTTSLVDAIADLDRAIDELSGSFNLFD